MQCCYSVPGTQLISATPRPPSLSAFGFGTAMPISDDQKQYVAYLLELMHAIGAVYARPMFGGHGIFLDTLMFALVSDGILYFKADSESSAAFKEKGLEAFSYMKKGKAFKLSYFQAPEETLEDGQEMVIWAHQAYAVALKANANNTNAT